MNVKNIIFFAVIVCQCCKTCFWAIQLVGTLQAGNNGVDGITSGISLRALVSVDSEYVLFYFYISSFLPY